MAFGFLALSSSLFCTYCVPSPVPGVGDKPPESHTVCPNRAHIVGRGAGQKQSKYLHCRKGGQEGGGARLAGWPGRASKEGPQRKSTEIRAWKRQVSGMPRSIPDRGNRKCKGPEAAVFGVWRSSQGARLRGPARGEELRPHLEVGASAAGP